MRRLLAIFVFATAAAAATAAGSGVVVAPHIHPPGTPLFHSHVLAAYRLPLFLSVLRARLDPRQGLLSEESVFDMAATLVLALLALTVPRLPRPALRSIGELRVAALSRAAAHAPLIHGPPRVALHA